MLKLSFKAIKEEKPSVNNNNNVPQSEQVPPQKVQTSQQALSKVSCRYCAIYL